MFDDGSAQHLISRGMPSVLPRMHPVPVAKPCNIKYPVPNNGHWSMVMILTHCTSVLQIGSMMLRSIPLHSRMMLTAAKMLYKLSKDSSNDARFRHHGVLRPLLSVIAENSKAVCQAHGQVVTGSGASDQSLVNSNNPTPQQHRQQDGTALLYLTGCLKNVSADATNQKCLGRLGAVGTMAQVRVRVLHNVHYRWGLHLGLPHCWHWWYRALIPVTWLLLQRTIPIVIFQAPCMTAVTLFSHCSLQVGV